MKNASLLLNVVLGLSLIYVIYKDKKETTQVAAQQNQPVNCSNVCMDYSNNPDYTILDGATVYNMAYDYKKSPNHNPMDATSVWFDLNDLKKFIWNIQSSICKQNCNPDSLKLGIRIYYARYPQTGPTAPEPFKDLPVEYTGKHTVFMIPTYQIRDSINQDFYMNKPFADCIPLAIPPDGKIDPIGLLIPLGKNHGTLCPPICSGTAF
jgi:hypothetical protein